MLKFLLKIVYDLKFICRTSAHYKQGENIRMIYNGDKITLLILNYCYGMFVVK